MAAPQAELRQADLTIQARVSTLGASDLGRLTLSWLRQ